MNQPNTDIKTQIRPFVKLLFFTTAVVIPLIFFVQVKHHYEFPKTMTARFLMIPAIFLFFLTFPERFKKAENPFRLPFLLLLVAACLSSLKSVNLCETLDSKYLPEIFLFLLTAHFLVAARFNEKDIHFYGFLLTVAALLSAIYGTIQFYQLEGTILKGPLQALAVQGTKRLEPVAFQGNRNYSSEFYNLAWPMTLALLFLSRRWLSRSFYLFSFFFIRYHLLVANTRATEVGLVFTLPLALLILFWTRRNEWTRLLFIFIVYWFLENIMETSVKQRGFAGWPPEIWGELFLVHLLAPLLVYFGYYFLSPVAASYLDPKQTELQGSADQRFRQLFQDVVHGRLPEYAKSIKGHLSLTRRAQHLFLILVGTLGVIGIGIGGTFAMSKAYHKYLLEEQVFQRRKSVYSSFFQEWLGPKTYSYQARNPEYIRKWKRDPIPPDQDWRVPGFSDFVKDKVDEKFFWDRSITFRIEVYNSALAMIRDNIPFGIGIGTFKIIHDLYTSQLERFVLGKEVLARKVHDEYMTFAGMHGALGLLALFWIQMLFLKLSYRILRACRLERIHVLAARLGSRRRAETILFLTFGLFWGLAITFVSMVFGHSLTLPTSHFLSYVSLGLLVVLYHAAFGSEKSKHWAAKKDKPARNVSNRVVLAVALSLVLIIPMFFQWMGEGFLQQGMQMRHWYDWHVEQIENFKKQAGGKLNPAAEKRVCDYLYRSFEANAPHLVKYMNGPYYSFSEVKQKVETTLFGFMYKSIETWPYHMETYYILGRYCIDFNRPDEGIEVLTKDLFMNPNYKWAHNNIGVCFDQSGAYHKARDVYYRALLIDPQQIFAHFNLAQGYLTKLRDFPMAVKHYRGVLDSNPNRLDVYGKLAYSLIQTGEYAEAEQAIEDYFYFKERLRTNTEGYINDDLANYQLLAELYQRWNRPDKLEQACKEILRLNPGAHFFRRQLAKALVNQNRLKEAQAQLQHLYYLLPKDADTRIQLAELTMVIDKDFEKALQYVQEAAALGGDRVRKVIQERALLDPLREDPRFQAILAATDEP